MEMNPEGVQQHAGSDEKLNSIFPAIKTKSLGDTVDSLLFLTLLKFMAYSSRIIFRSLQLLYLSLI